MARHSGSSVAPGTIADDPPGFACREASAVIATSSATAADSPAAKDLFPRPSHDMRYARRHAQTPNRRCCRHIARSKVESRVDTGGCVSGSLERRRLLVDHVADPAAICQGRAYELHLRTNSVALQRLESAAIRGGHLRSPVSSKTWSPARFHGSHSSWGGRVSGSGRAAHEMTFNTFAVLRSDGWYQLVPKRPVFQWDFGH